MQSKLSFDQCTPAQVAAAVQYAENQEHITVEVVQPKSGSIGFYPHFGLESAYAQQAWSDFCCEVTSAIWNA